MCTSTFSRLNSDPGNQRCTLVSSLQASPTELDLRKIKIYMHSFKILKNYLRYMAATKQASKQASTHTHVRNAVTLVWGSLRLAPISVN